VETTVYLVRPGVTDWHRERKVVGSRDIGLSADGQQQARAVAEALATVPLAEIVSSPVLRAVQTAEVLAQRIGANITRDPRLTDLRVGRWETMAYDDVARLPEYQKLMADPLHVALPGGEDLRQVRDRAVGAIDQALRDAPAGESIAIITHGGVCRLLLAHYLGIDLAGWQRLRVAPGSISILAFRDDRGLPRVHALGWRDSLKETL
jgi:broad specificity phosphatase PhoE